MLRRTIRCLTITLAAVAITLPVSAQQKRLTLDDVYGTGRRPDFSGGAPFRLTWMDDRHYLWPKEVRPGDRTSGVEWLKVEAETGKTEPLFDAGRFEAALAKTPGVEPASARIRARSAGLSFDPKYTGTLLTLDGDLHYYSFGSGMLTRLTSASGEEEEATFSPDGASVAFVRGGNLYVVDRARPRERQLTRDGGGLVQNGKLDWVYFEELYNRSWRGYWWSPDSSHLAFLQVDDRPVPEYPITDHVAGPYAARSTRYPRAGDPNPEAKLGIVRASDGSTAWADLSRYTPGRYLIVNVDWKRDSRAVVYQVQNREQTWLDLNLADPGSGASRTLLRETSQAWVDILGSPKWLKDGSLLWRSGRSGRTHLYHFAADGKLIRPVTTGEWDVTALSGVDESAGWVYFQGTERSPTGDDLYRTRLDGTGMHRLTQASGTHTARVSPGATAFIDTFSDAGTPPQVQLCRADGAPIRVLHRPSLELVKRYRLVRPELHQVKTRDGFTMEAALYKPPDFDPSRKYPVLHMVYGGPGAPTVDNRWSFDLFRQLVVQQGVLVWLCDNRTASAKGIRSAWPLYRNFGELELRDVEDGLGWLKQQPYVDADRIGISGWSFGGYLTSYALTHSKSFAMGIAGGSVTDWREYDSIYTERYMGLPQDNPEGYQRSSVRAAAKDLHGKLLLIHGTMDDNVHMQNTLQLSYDLQRAGKPFRLMLYPRAGHGVSDRQQVRHMREMMMEFIRETLRPEDPPNTALRDDR